jgi:hypothetical protein
MVILKWENLSVTAVAAAKFRKMFPSFVLNLVTCAKLSFHVMTVRF